MSDSTRQIFLKRCKLRFHGKERFRNAQVLKGLPINEFIDPMGSSPGPSV